MKIAIMGSGGVGGYFGAKLALGGNDVHFIARGSHLKAIRNQGIIVHSPLGDLNVDWAQATDNAADIGVVDVVVISVKLWDTEEAAETIKPLIGPETLVISLQNGVAKDDILKDVIGEHNVAGGVCYIAASIESPGVIAHANSLQTLIMGEYEGHRSDRIERFYLACLDSGIDAQISDDIALEIWEKFVFLVGLSGTTATTRCPIGRIRENEGTRKLLEALMRETVEVGRAEGVHLDANYAAVRLDFCDGLPEDMTASMLGDLERGHRLEIDWLSGDVSARGTRLGLPTPSNTTVTQILGIHAHGTK